MNWTGGFYDSYYYLVDEIIKGEVCSNIGDIFLLDGCYIIAYKGEPDYGDYNNV